MRLLLLACTGGAIGAGARFLIYQTFGTVMVARDAFPFPWPTLLINVSGGFLMGFLTVFIGARMGGSPEWRTFLATGILGGYTTFSAYSLEMMNLYIEGPFSFRFFAYTFGSVVFAFLALMAGMSLARAVLP